MSCSVCVCTCSSKRKPMNPETKGRFSFSWRRGRWSFSKCHHGCSNAPFVHLLNSIMEVEEESQLPSPFCTPSSRSCCGASGSRKEDPLRFKETLRVFFPNINLVSETLNTFEHRKRSCLPEEIIAESFCVHRK